MSMLLGAFAGSAIGGATSGITQVLLRPAMIALQKTLPFEPMPINSILAARLRKEYDDKKYFEEMSAYGIGKENAQKYLNVGMQVFDIETVVTLERRGSMNEKQAIEAAGFVGYNEKMYKQLKTALSYYPSPQDLITFLVREVYTPEIVAKFGQDLEFPEAAIKKGAEIGIDVTRLKEFWAAHWQLPSTTLVFQCLHRYAPDIVGDSKDDLKFLGLNEDDVKTDKETVMLLLKTQDVMPYWRARVLAIAFENLTRVDIRRLIRFGFLDYQGAYVATRKLGYTPKNAELLTKFGYVVESLTDWQDAIDAGSKSIDSIIATFKDWHITEPQIIQLVKDKLDPAAKKKLEPYRQRSLAIIIKALKKGVIKRDEAITSLKAINYDEATAKFIIEVEMYDETQDNKIKRITPKDLSKSDLLKRYALGLDDRGITTAKLQAIGYSEVEALELLAIEDRKPKKESKA